MKRLFVLCLVSVAMVSICQTNEEMWTSELEEVTTSHSRRCSKNCHCPESCRCRICHQYKSDNTKGCVAAYCDSASSERGCGCSSDNGGCCNCLLLPIVIK